MPEILRICADRSEEDILLRAAAIVAGGGVIGYPTETFYGLGADATQEQAIKRIFQIKGRNFSNPLPLLIGFRQDIYSLVQKIPEKAEILMDAFWPGPLTIVFEAVPHLSQLLTAKSGKIGIRQSGHKGARKIAEKARRPLTATSANLSGMPECKTADQVITQLGDRLDAVVDLQGGNSALGSTIIDITFENPKILRAGVISREDIEQKTGLTVIL